MELVERLKARREFARRQGLAAAGAGPGGDAGDAAYPGDQLAAGTRPRRRSSTRATSTSASPRPPRAGWSCPTSRTPQDALPARARRGARRADRDRARGQDPAGRDERRHVHDHQRRRRSASTRGTPIINPGESAILCFGAVRKQPWVVSSDGRRDRGAPGHARSRCPSTTATSTARRARGSWPTWPGSSRTRPPRCCSEPRSDHVAASAIRRDPPHPLNVRTNACAHWSNDRRLDKPGSPAPFGRVVEVSVQYGFAIDQRTCIGCHACTVACKTEHEVPVGQFRTWVKYVDKGEFPSTTREFGVHALQPLHRRALRQDLPHPGAVQARGRHRRLRQRAAASAARPACRPARTTRSTSTRTPTPRPSATSARTASTRVSSRPASWSAPPSRSGSATSTTPRARSASSSPPRRPRSAPPSRTPARTSTTSGADRTVLDPLAAPVDDAYIWAQPDSLRLAVQRDLPGRPRDQGPHHPEHRAPAPVGLEGHHLPVDQGVRCGRPDGGPAGPGAGRRPRLGRRPIATPIIALLGARWSPAVFLVWDLKRPERFLYLLLKPNPTSWLFRGGGDPRPSRRRWPSCGSCSESSTGPTLIDWIAAPAAAAGAAHRRLHRRILFGQAEGRDLWQSPLLFWHLVVQAVMVGAGAPAARRTLRRLSADATALAGPGPGGRDRPAPVRCSLVEYSGSARDPRRGQAPRT